MSNYITIKLRRGTAAQWTATNPVLAEGEVGLETDTRKFKVGDGATSWNSLQYWGGSGGAADFIDLGDVPVSYAGAGGQYVKVKQTADGLEFEPIEAADLPSGIDAAKIADGTVSNTEFQTLNGVTSAIQTQLDGKAPTVHTHTVSQITPISSHKLVGRHGGGSGDGQEVGIDGGLEFHGGNIRRSAISGDVSIPAGSDTATITGLDAAKIADGSVSNAEFQTLNGVTSAIQTQLDGKQAALGFTPENVANKSTSVTTDQASNTKYPSVKAVFDWVTGLGYITASALTGYATQAWVAAQGYITNVVTALGYTPANKAGDTFTGNISATNLSGTNTGDQTITLTGDVTGTGTGSFAATIANDAVTNAKLANMDTARFKARITSGSGDPEDLTGTQATTLLDTFTISLKGLAPASGGGTTNFLRADGTWAAPAGGGGGADGTVLSPAQITAWENNYNPASWASTVGVLRINSNQFHFLSGLTATTDGHTVRIFNTGSYPIGLYNQNTDSTAANRFSFDDQDVIILPQNSVELYYDGTAQRWSLAAGWTLNSESAFVSKYWNEGFTTNGDSHGATSALWPVSGGTATASATGGVTGSRVGIVDLATGTGASGRAAFYASANSSMAYNDGTGKSYMEFKAEFRSPAVLSDATNEYFIHAGFIDSVVADSADGAFLKYTHGLNSGQWQFLTADNTTRTTGNSTVALAVNTWYCLRVVMYPNGTAEFYVDGVSLGRNTANLPGSARDFSFGIVLRKNAGTTARNMLVDGCGYTVVKYRK